MATKEEEFKQRLAAVLLDLRSAGKDDAEAMWLIGSLAAVLVDKVRAPSWREFKERLTSTAYDGLLRDFQLQGNAFHREGKGRHAYAIQALGMSLIARTQQDPQVKEGGALLDEVIERAIAAYRQSRGPQSVN